MKSWHVTETEIEGYDSRKQYVNQRASVDYEFQVKLYEIQELSCSQNERMQGERLLKILPGVVGEGPC
jgi:hypothetical protein